MKPKYCLLIFGFFLYYSVLGQERVYETVGGKRISKEKFIKERSENELMYAYRYSNDTLINFLYRGNRAFKGKLNIEDIKEFRKRFKFKKNNKPVIITYFHGLDDCKRHLADRPDQFIRMERESYESLSKTTLAYNYYWSDTGVEELVKSLKWNRDEDEWIFTRFFPYHFPCGSYVVVDYEGNYRGYFGEYMHSQIIKDFNKLK